MQPSAGWPTTSCWLCRWAWSSASASAREDVSRAALAPPASEDARLRAAIVAGLSRRVGREVELTADQSAAMDTVRQDLGQRTPMLRLIQGDVGSGKTAVAAYALGLAASSGGQGALLAPTDLLARQLAETIGDLLDDAGVAGDAAHGLPQRGRPQDGRARPWPWVRHRSWWARTRCLQESVSYARLDLVVIDEQHRFGVAQREALAAKGVSPHVLLMTATPIPRTLGQVLYADLDVSDLRTAPSGRPATRTGVKAPARPGRHLGAVRSEAAAGHRTFVVVPHIDPQGSEDGDDSAELPPSLPASDDFEEARGAEEVAERLRGAAGPGAGGPGARTHACSRS